MTDSPADKIPVVLRYIEHFQKTLEQAKLRLQQAQQRQKAYADRHKRHVEYEEGEEVLLNSRNLNLKHPGSRKLLPHWVGPFTVERHIGPVAYRLALTVCAQYTRCFMYRDSQSIVQMVGVSHLRLR